MVRRHVVSKNASKQQQYMDKRETETTQTRKKGRTVEQHTYLRVAITHTEVTLANYGDPDAHGRRVDVSNVHVTECLQ
jgi:hypothetical protein